MSNLIKSSSVVSTEQLRLLEWINRQQQASAGKPGEARPDRHAEPDADTMELRDQIINDAQSFADERLQEVAEECKEMLSEAEAQIEAWWSERRSADEAVLEEAKGAGYNAGYSEGASEAERQLGEQWHSRLSQAEEVLKQAYTMREQIIQEAEPFLVELSCAIAEKIVGHQLTTAPEMTIELIRKALSRRREQGVITLCVAPSQLAFVQAAREELHTAIDSQAELQILADSSVKDNGCIIRSAFGSIDARVDTQLAEIKRELIRIAHHSNEERGDGDEREQT